MPAPLEIFVERFEVPSDRDAVIRELRARRPGSPAEVVSRGLQLCNLSHPGELHAPLHVFLRDPDSGEIHGGLVGRTGRGGLFVEQLWVAEAHRRQGHGSRLLQAAEREARSRRCRFAYLDTYSFHGPDFYREQGYSVFGRLAGFTGGHTRFYLRKDLEPDEGEGSG